MTLGLELLELLMTMLLYTLAFVWSMLAGISVLLIFAVWRENRKEDSKLGKIEVEDDR